MGKNLGGGGEINCNFEAGMKMVFSGVGKVLANSSSLSHFCDNAGKGRRNFYVSARTFFPNELSWQGCTEYFIVSTVFLHT